MGELFEEDKMLQALEGESIRDERGRMIAKILNGTMLSVRLGDEIKGAIKYERDRKSSFSPALTYMLDLAEALAWRIKVEFANKKQEGDSRFNDLEKLQIAAHVRYLEALGIPFNDLSIEELVKLKTQFNNFVSINHCKDKPIGAKSVEEAIVIWRRDLLPSAEPVAQLINAGFDYVGNASFSDLDRAIARYDFAHKEPLFHGGQIFGIANGMIHGGDYLPIFLYVDDYNNGIVSVRSFLASSQIGVQKFRAGHLVKRCAPYLALKLGDFRDTVPELADSPNKLIQQIRVN